MFCSSVQQTSGAVQWCIQYNPGAEATDQSAGGRPEEC